MATHALAAADFDQTIDTNPIVFIDWWAPWCGPCKAFAPTYETFSETYANVFFAKINTDEEQSLAGEFGIQSIPTLMAFREGILVFAQAGLLAPTAFEALIAKVCGLDMDEVRRSIEEQEKQAPTQEEFEE